MLGAISGTQIYSYNFETLELMRESLANGARALPPAPSKRAVHVSIPELAFESIADAREREFFNHVPTSFNLPDETVDRLIGAGRQLLRESPDYQRLLAYLR